MLFSTRRISLFAAAVVVALGAVPAIANANVYCVDVSPTTGCDSNYTLEAGLQQALDDAAAHGGADTVRIAQLSYSTPGPNGFSYSHLGDAIKIEGVGAGAAIEISAPNSVPANPTTYLGLEISTGGAPVTLSKLKVILPTPPDAPVNEKQTYDGMVIHDPATIDDVTIEGPDGVAVNGTGLMISGGTITNLAVDVATESIGFSGLNQANSTAADLTVRNSTISADIPVNFTNTDAGDLLVRRSTLRVGPNGGIGAWVQEGDAAIEDTLIDMGGFSSNKGVVAGFNNPGSHTATVNVDGVTIAHGGAFDSRGLVADIGPLGGGSDQFTINARNTIIDQTLDFAVYRRADAGGAANVHLAYSNYNPADVFETNDINGDDSDPFGVGAITATDSTNLDPMFVGPTDFHLQASSPLIDAGDPAAPAPGRLDLDGDARVTLAKPGCAPRRDIGSDEYAPPTPVAPLDCAAPDTTILTHPKPKTKSRKASFTFSSTEPASTFLCSYDGRPFVACASPFSTPKLTKGRHRFDVLSTDAAGNRDQSAATFSWKVKKQRRH